MGSLEEGQTRIDQHYALQWAWTLLRDLDRKSDQFEPLLVQAKDEIGEKLQELSAMKNIDFDALTKELTERV